MLALFTKIFSFGFLATLLAQILKYLGLSVVGFTAVDLVMDPLIAQFDSYLSGVPSAARSLIDLAGITTVVQWMISAYASAALIKYSGVFMSRTKYQIINN